MGRLLFPAALLFERVLAQKEPAEADLVGQQMLSRVPQDCVARARSKSQKQWLSPKARI